jgi:ribosomal protein L22
MSEKPTDEQGPEGVEQVEAAAQEKPAAAKKPATKKPAEEKKPAAKKRAEESAEKKPAAKKATAAKAPEAKEIEKDKPATAPKASSKEDSAEKGPLSAAAKEDESAVAEEGGQPVTKTAAEKQAAKKPADKKPADKKLADKKLVEKESVAEKQDLAKAEKPADSASRDARTGPPAPARRKVVRAQARYVRTSARKARMVCGHLRGKSVPEARAILAFTPREVARDWSKLLESAVANAENNHELVEDDLFVREAFADEGPTIKRFRPRAQGRATPIRKRTSHLTITLTPKP